MLRPIQRWIQQICSAKGAKLSLSVWLIILVLLSALAPSSKPYAVSTGEGSINDDTPSAIAEQLLKEKFPNDDGLTALLVFHSDLPITSAEREHVVKLSEWLSSSERPTAISSALPFHRLPPQVQSGLFSSDKTTLLLNLTLKPHLESGVTRDTLELIQEQAKAIGFGGMKLNITGPAGISADTLMLFRNADFVLMIATVVLILVLLIVIYRSPLLAVIPLLIAGIIYQITDKILGIAAKNNWFIVDKQALSIMMILLFAVLTDYCLFVFSRYREELNATESKYEAMKTTMTHVSEPILFSGGTVLIAMLTLFAALFKPYHHFAPVFGVALVVIALSGITLIPAVFALVGRKAFWPFIPKINAPKRQKEYFWTKIGRTVGRKPGWIAVVLLIGLVLASVNAGNIRYSFNLLKSFPQDMASRQGFEILEQRFPPGQLAPVTVLVESKQTFTPNAVWTKNVIALSNQLKQQPGIFEVTPNLNEKKNPQGSILSNDKQSFKLQLILEDNPYDRQAIDVLQSLRDRSEWLLQGSGFDPSQYKLHFAGQTANQLDVRKLNEQDTLIVFSLVALFITLMLLLQTRSIRLALFMIATILLSYTATLGLGWVIFEKLLGYSEISYRLPMYTFVFLVALGVDYNIMLVSRIKEYARTMNWKEAVVQGVAHTGGVISSAGLILAATFSVLITQPMQELFLFGLTMALGVLIDTFLVRGMLLPSLLILTGKRSRTSPIDMSKQA